ncbi:hypothetical protein psal_cds_259 [Pandoravirus salinus]|uniref:Uncharacterized protein n=1 Tax=Pandoravirus salinus TaxID=1349410 RepID=S4VU01_9VIRU|nr:Atrophin-1 superfamily incomplete domain [Pandoravirus salinus]AGO83823.1 hypothetical protein psal_cds_259 [Pandoravirus salinus]
MSGTDERRHHRQGHEDRDQVDAEGDAAPWDPHADHEVHSMRANSIKFTQTDGGDPDAVVQLHMGRDLGIYARTRSTRRRIDAVAPGKPGALAAYVKGGAVGPVDWARTDVDPDTGAAVLHLGAGLIVDDVLIKERGSVGKAIDALREAAILADQHRVALERKVKELDDALSASESRVDALVQLVNGMQHIRVEHESEATAAAWFFRTSMRPDGTNVFGVVSSDGVSRAAFCARPRLPSSTGDDPHRDNSANNANRNNSNNNNNNNEETAQPDNDSVTASARVQVSDQVVAVPPEPTSEAQIAADPWTPGTEPHDKEDAPPEREEPGASAIAAADGTVADTLVPAIPDVPLSMTTTTATSATISIEPVVPDEPATEAAAIPIPTQQRRTKGARKARSATTATDAPGSPPPAAVRGVKTRQSARRASAYSAGAHADPPAAVTMARPTDDAESA